VGSKLEFDRVWAGLSANFAANFEWAQSTLWSAVSEDTHGKLVAGLFGAILGAAVQWYLKRRRLREAIRMEVFLTSEMFKNTFSPQVRIRLDNWIKSNPTLPVVLPTSDRHVIIGNLTDDIAYMHPATARRIIRFNDLSELIDDAISFMRSHEFTLLPEAIKMKILAVPFDKQDNLQGLAMQLLEEL
jgi:hypothetical protein